MDQFSKRIFGLWTLEHFIIIRETDWRACYPLSQASIEQIKVACTMLHCLCELCVGVLVLHRSVHINEWQVDSIHTLLVVYYRNLYPRCLSQFWYTQSYYEHSFSLTLSTCMDNGHDSSDALFLLLFSLSMLSTVCGCYLSKSLLLLLPMLLEASIYIHSMPASTSTRYRRSGRKIHGCIRLNVCICVTKRVKEQSK